MTIHESYRALIKFRACGRAMAEYHCGSNIADFFIQILRDITGPLMSSACRHKAGSRVPVKYMLRRRTTGKSSATPTAMPSHAAFHGIPILLSVLLVSRNYLATWLHPVEAYDEKRLHSLKSSVKSIRCTKGPFYMSVWVFVFVTYLYFAMIKPNASAMVYV